MSTQEQYDAVLRDALEHVFVVAARQGLDTGQLAAEFDAGRNPGIYRAHTLTISIRDTSIAVTDDDIQHEWLSIGTGFVDSRFSQHIAGLLLSDLERKAQGDGRFI